MTLNIIITISSHIHAPTAPARKPKLTSIQQYVFHALRALVSGLGSHSKIGVLQPTFELPGLYESAVDLADERKVVHCR